MKLQLINEKYIELLTGIREYFNLSNISIHKARNEIRVIEFLEDELVVKSFKVPHLINKFVYTFFKNSKAKKSYDNSIKIIDFTPRPIGFIEFRKFGLISDSYFISENFKYDFTIRNTLKDKKFKNRDRVFQSFVEFTFELHKNNIYHLDYSPGNILIKQDGDNYIFKIVDINRMQFKELTLDEKLGNFSKLWALDDDLEIIIRKYAKLLNQDESSCVDIALKLSQEHKDRKNMKKRLKGKKVVD